MSAESGISGAAVGRLADPSAPPAIAEEKTAERVRPPGSPCANCATILQGPWCHACGQLAEDFENRSLLSLAGETVEGLLHADGRLLATLRRLILHPAALTRDYLSGKRASQLPPLRLFLVVVFLFFLAGALVPGHQLRSETAPESYGGASANVAQSLPRELAWLAPKIAYARAHPSALGEEIQSRLHDLAILFLPIATLIMALLFPFDPRFRIYDHAIFAMHSLAFLGLLGTLATVLSLIPGFPAGLLLIAAPAHLFVHLRGIYRVSVVGVLVRMAVLFFLSLLAYALLMTATVLVGLAALRTA
ncbi:MAG: DUF3667 domain-containing protein [Caulobacteraceae bacterium]